MIEIYFHDCRVRNMKSWMILKSIGGKLRMRMGMYNLFQETITDNILYRLPLKFATHKFTYVWSDVANYKK